MLQIGREAMQGTLQVAIGLDSHMQGEADIGRQVSHAFSKSHADGQADGVLHLLQQSVHRLLGRGRKLGFIRPNRGLGLLAVQTLQRLELPMTTQVGVVGTGAMVLATQADSPYKTFADVVAAGRTAKGVSYGSIGSGSLGHLAVALLARGTRLKLVHVPYRGGGPLMNDALAGHVPLSVGSVFLTKPHLDSKRLRALAVTTSRRSANLPDVPTVAESGFAGFDAPAWWAVLAPAKTPPEIVKRMNEELNKALKTPEIGRAHV